MSPVRAATSVALLLVSCGGGATSCSGCGGGDYRYPDGDPTRPDAVVLEDAVRVRVTQDFLDFIRPQLPSVIRAALAGQSGLRVDANDILHVPLPDARLFDIGVAEADVRDAEALIWLDDLEQQVRLDFETPNQVRLRLEGLRLGLNAKLKGDLIEGDFSCPIRGDLGPGPVRHAAVMTIDATIDPGVGPRPQQLLDLRVRLGNLQLNDLDLRVAGQGTYCNEPECRDCALEVFGTCLDPGGRCVECQIACGGITGTAVNLVSGLLDLLRPVLNDALEPIAETLLGDTLRQLNGQPARLEAQLSLAELTGLDFVRGQPVGVYVGPRSGRFPVTDRNGLGMDVAVNAGAEGTVADCVSELPPFDPTRGPVPELAGTDGDGRPYHWAATLSAAYLNQVLYAVHRSGSLCLKLGSEDVAELTGGAFSLNASLLSLLATDLGALASDTAPVIVELKPRRPGRIELGSGAETGTDPMGNPTYDWLLKLDIEDVGVAFHVLVEDRYVRVFEVGADAFVGMNVVVLPDNRLELALGELRIDGFEERFNELLPNADFAEVLPSLLDIALGTFLNQSLTFDIDVSTAVSDALGGAPVGLRVNDIFRDGAMQDYLTMSLTFTTSTVAASLWPVDTRASLDADPGLLDRTGPRARPTGRIRLRVGEELPHSAEDGLEYQVRVDGGMWSVPRRPLSEGVLWVPQPRLELPGYHRVEVRARRSDDYATLDPEPVLLHVVVDPIAPTVSARWIEDGLALRVRDAHTLDPRELELEVEVNGAPVPVRLAPWDAHSARAVVPLDRVLGQTVEAAGIDPAGNRSRPVVIDVPVAPPEIGPATIPPTGCGHAQSTGASPAAGMALLSLVSMAILARRRRGASAG